MTDENPSTILTGIKPTGTPHIGNYLGAIEPALRQAANYDQAFFFIADYHALNTKDGETLKELTRNLAATWLASGLDPNTAHFYRQSDISEIFELETILNQTSVPKGWMNKMHAYKAAVDRNKAANKPDDYEVSMGLYTYPILMAGDILIFNATNVPVGRDQIQHVEIARDIAQRFNSQFSSDVFVLPEHVIRDGIAELPGIDGRKMSKSYNNTVPLFATREQWADAARKIVTDSIEHTPETIRETTLVKLFTTIASPEKTDELANALVTKTIGWKEAKEQFVDALEDRFGEQSKRYFELIQNPEYLDAILAEGAAKIRPLAQQHLRAIKNALGL